MSVLPIGLFMVAFGVILSWILLPVSIKLSLIEKWCSEKSREKYFMSTVPNFPKPVFDEKRYLAWKKLKATFWGLLTTTLTLIILGGIMAIFGSLQI